MIPVGSPQTGARFFFCLCFLALLAVCACRSPVDMPPEPEYTPRQAHSGPDPVTPPAEPGSTTGEKRATAPAQLPAIPFTIQVGAFSTVQRAAGYADSLEALGLDAFYFVDGDGLYKVRFERFQTKPAALARAQTLKQADIIQDFYIVQPGRRAVQNDKASLLRKDLVDTARRFLGIPYRWGGASAQKGFDCSGLTMTVYRLNGLDLPRKAYSQYRAGTAVGRSEISPGDLVFFATASGDRVSHVGLYSGAGKFIHAPRRGKSIRISSLSSVYFKQRYKGARRYF